MSVRAFQRKRTLVWIAGVLGVVAFAGGVLSLLVRVDSGRGLASYRTGRGYETTAVQVLATVAFVAVIFIGYRVAAAIRGRRRS